MIRRSDVGGNVVVSGDAGGLLEFPSFIGDKGVAGVPVVDGDVVEDVVEVGLLDALDCRRGVDRIVDRVDAVGEVIEDDESMLVSSNDAVDGDSGCRLGVGATVDRVDAVDEVVDIDSPANVLGDVLLDDDDDDVWIGDAKGCMGLLGPAGLGAEAGRNEGDVVWGNSVSEEGRWWLI